MFVRCRCDCGNERIIRLYSLKIGDTQSCGCLQRERISERARKGNVRHGNARGNKRTPEYCAWVAARHRCSNPKDKRYEHYGGRGITVCDRWNSFENFLADMGPRPEGTSIERKDNDGNYEPGNCIWADIATQARNKRNNRYYDFRGQRMIVADIARAVGINVRNLRRRLDNLNWPLERAIQP